MEKYNEREVLENMLDDVEGYIDNLHKKQEKDGKNYKEAEILLYEERAAILDLIRKLIK